MSNVVIGLCSLCGGNVCIPDVWYGVNYPTPTCQRCGATAPPPNKHVIPMQKNYNDTNKTAITYEGHMGGSPKFLQE